MRKILLLALSAFVGSAIAEEAVTVVALKDPKVGLVLSLPRSHTYVLADPDPVPSSFGSVPEAALADTWCKRLAYTYWSNSRHPGYKRVAHLNQNQDGLGFKCRKSGPHPTFMSFDTMTNSQFGTTVAVSLGKEIDLIDFYGVRYYHGISITALSYEMPARRRTAYGAVPIWHRGVSVDLSQVPLVLPFKFRGTIGWEELTLPKDRIRVRSWNMSIKKEF